MREGQKVRAVIGAALQEAALAPLLTGREHLKLQAALHGLSRKERKKRGDELLERVGLAEAADRRVRSYSGGTFAFAVGTAVVLLLVPWALFGLRNAEKAG